MNPIKSLLSSIFCRKIRHSENVFIRNTPPGHFYSPIPDLAEITDNRDAIFANLPECPGVNINEADQLALARSFRDYHDTFPFMAETSPALRYYLNNGYFGGGDAFALYSMIRHFQPKRIVEVGSGFSSALMLDTIDRFIPDKPEVTFIEPFPLRLRTLLSDNDRARCTILEMRVQNVPIERFTSLQENDLLFIDSSHVVKTGSDVVHIIANILPRLNCGVLVHFHDIGWPFEYPEEWLRDGRAWSEAYMLRAFLQYNSAFEILFFNAYLGARHGEFMTDCLPGFMRMAGGSIWIRRLS